MLLLASLQTKSLLDRLYELIVSGFLHHSSSNVTSSQIIAQFHTLTLSFTT